MKFLKIPLLLAVVAAVTFGLVVPSVWLYTVSNLPNPIDSPHDVEMHLRSTIESHRQSVEGKKPVRDRVQTDWPTPELAKLPKLLVDMYLAETGCPNFFTTTRDDGLRWRKRLLLSLINQQMSGDGACELIFAHHIARQLDAKTPVQQAVVADRLLQFLTREQMVAYDLESTEHARGLVGIEAVSKKLLGRTLKELSVAETAELQLATPPDGFFEEVEKCKNASLIKQGRDNILKRMGELGVITPEVALTSSSQPVRCLQWRK